jgi:hypothetical protein
MKTRTLIFAAALALAGQPLLAQNKKVFRCDSGTGQITYSDEACKGGTELRNDDSRSADQRAAAQESARREAQLADKLTRERRAAEKSSAGPAVGLIPHLAAEKAAKDPAADKKRATKKKTKQQKTEKQTPQA